MKRKTKETKKNNNTFYSRQGIVLMAALLLLFVILALAGMSALGVIRLPAALASLFGNPEESTSPSAAENIAPEGEGAILYEAIPREEYAKALADMQIAESYYRAYTVKVSFGIRSEVTDYVAIRRGDDWWVQTSQENVILSTAVCKDGSVRITDNAQNASVTAPEASDANPNGISFEERCGVLPLRRLVEMIRSVDAGEPVAYGGGIVDYSLSYTQARGTGENVFVFTFTGKNGVTEEYRFALESAVLLSVTKTLGDIKIYQMEMKEYRNDLTDIDADSLLTLG